MSTILADLFHRSGQCPFACFLKFVLSVFFIYALHVAAYHQADVTLHSYVWLLNIFAVIAVLAVAFHWSCQFRNADKG